MKLFWKKLSNEYVLVIWIYVIRYCFEFRASDFEIINAKLVTVLRKMLYIIASLFLKNLQIQLSFLYV